MVHGSLFSGIGGFDLAAQQLGFKNAFHCEWIESKRNILNKHFPESESYGDIREFDGRKYRGAIDIVSGGFPCQDISIANQSSKTNGAQGIRGGVHVYGKSTPVWLGKLNLELSSLKTAQCSLVEDSRLSYATFPSSGMMLNGDCFMLRNSAFRTKEKEFTELPTPAASDGKILLKTVASYKKYFRNGHQDKSLYQFQLNGFTANQAMIMYEWMMGFPKNWTKIESTD